MVYIASSWKCLVDHMQVYNFKARRLKLLDKSVGKYTINTAYGEIFL
jgi:hypothetical protein